MSVRKPAIPAITPYNTYYVLTAVKETVEVMTGARGGELTQLETTATLEETIQKINEIIIRMNASGK